MEGFFCRVYVNILKKIFPGKDFSRLHSHCALRRGSQEMGMATFILNLLCLKLKLLPSEIIFRCSLHDFC